MMIQTQLWNPGQALQARLLIQTQQPWPSFKTQTQQTQLCNPNHALQPRLWQKPESGLQTLARVGNLYLGCLVTHPQLYNPDQVFDPGLPFLTRPSFATQIQLCNPYPGL